MAQQPTTLQQQDEYLFDAFPAPRVWNFGEDDAWAGDIHTSSTADFLPDNREAEITIITGTIIGGNR